MKILFACHRLPFPPKRGGKIRPFHVIRHFHDLGHRVTVASLARSTEELEEGRGLSDYCENLLVGTIDSVSAMSKMILWLPTTSPSSMGYFHSAKLHRLVKRELESGDYDLIFVHCSSAAQYVRTADGIPSILDFGDMDSQKWLDYSRFKPQPLAAGYWLEGEKLERAEKRLAARFDLCTCTTRAEFETLNEMGAASRTAWFPNGVDGDYFFPTRDDYDPHSISFVGRMDYFPNQEGVIRFCQHILPRIRNELPSVRITIVGAAPPAKIRALATLPGVSVTGTVDDVRPYVHRSALTVAPLSIARGTQNKILESMSMGVPVVASRTAAGGVDAVPGEHILVADDDDDFVRHVLAILGSPVERNRLAASARGRMQSHHHWAHSMARVDEIVDSMIH